MTWVIFGEEGRRCRFFNFLMFCGALILRNREVNSLEKAMNFEHSNLEPCDNLRKMYEEYLNMGGELWSPKSMKFIKTNGILMISLSHLLFFMDC